MSREVIKAQQSPGARQTDCPLNVIQSRGVAVLCVASAAGVSRSVPTLFYRSPYARARLQKVFAFFPRQVYIGFRDCDRRRRGNAVISRLKSVPPDLYTVLCHSSWRVTLFMRRKTESPAIYSK